MLCKLTAAALIGAVALTTSLPTTASAFYYHPKPPIIPHSTSGATGAGAGATYDLVRRTTCIGDPWRLGGPGFTEKMPNSNVMIPQCSFLLAALVAKYRDGRVTIE